MGQGQRRKFLIAAGGVLAASLARAQGGAAGQVRRIGVLNLGSPDPKLPASEYPTSVALRKLGWVEGQTIAIERRFAEGKAERLAGLAQELIAKRVELIIAWDGAAAVAASRATRSIPIVFVNVAYPVERKLAASYARPGANVTGTATYFLEVAAKRYEILREIAPSTKFIYHTYFDAHSESYTGGGIPGFNEAIAKAGVTLLYHAIREPKDVDAFLAGALAWRAEALSVSPGVVLNPAIQKIVEFALKHRLPTVSGSRQFTDSGILVCYDLSREEGAALFNRAMEYVDRILRGANPAEMPVERPRAFELVINMKTAKALGLTVPRPLLLRADRLIE